MGNSHIEYIKDGSDVLAIIIRVSFSEEGMLFVTPGEFNLQVGVHVRPAGEVIPAHIHLNIETVVTLPIQEFLYIEKGRVKVDLYDKNEDFYTSTVIGPGDSILLLGGHKIEFLDDVKIVEIKQGPYQCKEKDKRMLKNP